LSSSNVRQQEIRRSDQASQYSDSDVQTATRPQPSNKAQSKVLWSSATFIIRGLIFLLNNLEFF
jgi:hypothetical protein